MDTTELVRDVTLAQAGDHEALDRCLRAVQGPIFRFVRATIGSGHDPEDVTQDTLFAICRKLKWLDEPRAFRAWGFQIAWRLGCRALSRAERRAMTTDHLLATIPAQQIEGTDPWLSEALRAGLSSLSPSTRPVVELHYGQGFTLNEVATVLGLKTGTVKSRLASGLNQLRETLASAGKGGLK